MVFGVVRIFRCGLFVLSVGVLRTVWFVRTVVLECRDFDIHVYKRSAHGTFLFTLREKTKTKNLVIYLVVLSRRLVVFFCGVF